MFEELKLHRTDVIFSRIRGSFIEVISTDLFTIDKLKEYKLSGANLRHY